ncbi:acyl carrier protein [Acetobacterium malicum]|jgi:acyl carrier protein|uniref:Acyl carrier protein n=1 Tax=Acetobacterium malicum TaxID=52692 RepID=A0ABR6YUN3_9FIRM|nr:MULTISPECIES: phosphopantetheine-binding protein [Acetobacterium]MBC3898822.1 acyl carrier protein [Acetobacterium malicum]MDD3306034.1 phosphopantetheine-binding protein [Acetobacterium sp.]PKM48140.1 MAG: acyl carrier protein [Firmicutes bacterium HGW-Firmicutes-6]
MVLEKVVEILRNYKDEQDLEVTMASTFEELELDSLDTVELVMEIEEAFDTSIEMDGELQTIGDVVTLIEKAIA